MYEYWASIKQYKNTSLHWTYFTFAESLLTLINCILLTPLISGNNTRHLACSFPYPSDYEMQVKQAMPSHRAFRAFRKRLPPGTGFPRHGDGRRCPREPPGLRGSSSPCLSVLPRRIPASLPLVPGDSSFPPSSPGGFPLPSLPPSEAGVAARRGRTTRARRAPPSGLHPRAAAARPARRKFSQPACQGSTVPVGEGAAGWRAGGAWRGSRGPALAGASTHSVPVPLMAAHPAGPTPLSPLGAKRGRAGPGRAGAAEPRPERPGPSPASDAPAPPGADPTATPGCCEPPRHCKPVIWMSVQFCDRLSF